MTTPCPTLYYALLRDFYDDYSFFTRHYRVENIIPLKKFKWKQEMYCLKKIL